MPKALTDSGEPVNILYYGEGGTGKTTAIAHMAKLGSVVIVNAESGVKARALRQYDIPIENLRIFPDTDEGETVSFEGLLSLWKSIYEKADGYEGIVGVGWDSITEIYQALLGDIVKSSYEKAIRNGRERDPSFIALEDYGIMTQQVRQLVRKFRDLPQHFAISALAKREQDNDGQVVYNPQVTAKLQTDLVGWVDVVCVTQVMSHPDGGEDEYRGIFRPTGKWRGKDRFNMLPRGIVDPSFDRILQYVDGELTVDEDPVMAAARERADAVKKQESEPVPA